MKFVNYKNGKYVLLKGKQIKESNRLGREEMQKPCPTDKPLIAQTCASVDTFVLTVVKNRLKKRIRAGTESIQFGCDETIYL